MNVQELKKRIAAGDTGGIEDAWMAGMEAKAPASEMKQVLEALVAAGKGEQAQTLGWMWLSELAAADPGAALAAAREVLPVLPASEELRKSAADLYRQAHGQVKHFEDFLNVSGLLANQTFKRAVRTLDICLSVETGGFLANRYDHQVLRAESFDPVMGAWRLIDAAGRGSSVDAKLLSDEFETVDENDFRVLVSFRRDKLGQMLSDDIASVLMGICTARGGKVDVDELKGLLVPDHLPADKWSGWWGRARTAVKKAPQLALEGRNPVSIVYHAAGRTLEQEAAEALQEARMPKQVYVVLRDYLRQVKQCGLPPDAALVGRLMDLLAKQAEEYRTRRRDDSMTAALAIDAAMAAGAPAPQRVYPSAAEQLAAAADPAQIVVRVDDRELWPAALEALAKRPDAAAQLERLMEMMPADELDAVAGRLIALGRKDAVDAAAARAFAAAGEHLQIALWLWVGPGVEVASPGSALDLLSRLLDVLQRFDREHLMEHAARRDAFQQIRAALDARDCATFRKAVAQMSEHVAETIKRRVGRSPGITDTLRDELMAIIREAFPGLFLRTRVDPWVDETVLWTTTESLHRKEAELKKLIEVDIPANSRAIGAAAEHGDLSENSEWKYALEEQRTLQARQIQLQNDLIRARALTRDDVPGDYVGIGSRVTLRPEAGGEPLVLTFLGPWDGDAPNNVYAYSSKLGLSLMGKAPGESVTVKLGGLEGQYVIEKTEPGL